MKECWTNIQVCFFCYRLYLPKTSNKDFRAKKKVLTHLNPMSHKRKKVFWIQQKLNLWTNWMQIKLKIKEGSFFKKSVIFLLFFFIYSPEYSPEKLSKHRFSVNILIFLNKKMLWPILPYSFSSILIAETPFISVKPFTAFGNRITPEKNTGTL